MDMLPTRVVTHMQRRMVHVMDIVVAVLAVESQVRAVDLDQDQAVAAVAVVLLENLTSIPVHGEVGQVGHHHRMILRLANLAKVEDIARRLVNLAKVALVI